MSRRWSRIFLALVMTATNFSTPAYAAKAAPEKSLGAFGVWHAYVDNEGGQKVCYMVTTKIVKSTGPKKRGAPYLMITHRPVEASSDVISYGSGVLLNSRRGVTLRVGTVVFDLFSVRDIAWARDSLTDHKIAAALQHAPTAQLSAYPVTKSMPAIHDGFDLAGASPAYRAIGKACGLIHDPVKKTIKKPSSAAPRPRSDQMKAQPLSSDR